MRIHQHCPQCGATILTTSRLCRPCSNANRVGRHVFDPTPEEIYLAKVRLNSQYLEACQAGGDTLMNPQPCGYKMRMRLKQKRA